MSESLPNTSLFSIEANIASLLALRDDAEADGDAEAVRVIDAEIETWAGQEVQGRKVDGIVWSIKEYRKRAEIAREEGQRMLDRAKAWEAKAERVEQSTLAAMLVHQITRIESETNVLRTQKNGGLQPLDVVLAELPEKYKLVTVTMSPADYDKLWDICLSQAWFPTMPTKSVSYLADAIRKALKEVVTCPECKGVFMECERCNDTGLIPRTIPGAKLLDRGHHLRMD